MDRELKVADEVWLATALLHRKQPERKGFSGNDILRQVEQLHPGSPPRKGVNPHIYGHCVANARPSSGRYRILYRNPDGTYRLYREGDDFHPRRVKGKIAPQPEDLPSKFHKLVDWYYSDYNRAQTQNASRKDPLLALRGVGKELWRGLGGGDAVIQWLRSDEVAPPPWERTSGEQTDKATEGKLGGEERLHAANDQDFDPVWQRVRRHEGAVFQTIRGLKFTYRITSNDSVRIRRNGSEINQDLSKEHFAKAWSRMPVAGPGDLQHDVRGPSYLFAILTDPRIAR